MRAAERRWIVLAEDGRHVSIGRHTDPSPEEIDRAGNQLCAIGLGGWLAVLEGSYYRPEDTLSLLLVREIAPAHGPTWSMAVETFLRIRTDMLSTA